MPVTLNDWTVEDVKQWGKELKLPDNEGIIFMDIIERNKLNGKAMSYIKWEMMETLVNKLSFGSKIIIQNELPKLMDIKYQVKSEMKTNSFDNDTEIDTILSTAKKYRSFNELNNTNTDSDVKTINSEIEYNNYNTNIPAFKFSKPPIVIPPNRQSSITPFSPIKSTNNVCIYLCVYIVCFIYFYDLFYRKRSLNGQYMNYTKINVNF